MLTDESDSYKAFKILLTIHQSFLKQCLVNLKLPYQIQAPIFITKSYAVIWKQLIIKSTDQHKAPQGISNQFISLNVLFINNEILHNAFTDWLERSKQHLGWKKNSWLSVRTIKFLAFKNLNCLKYEIELNSVLFLEWY